MGIRFIGSISAEKIADDARRLATDIERLAASGSPAAADLARAPVLHAWVRAGPADRGFDRTGARRRSR